MAERAHPPFLNYQPETSGAGGGPKPAAREGKAALRAALQPGRAGCGRHWHGDPGTAVTARRGGRAAACGAARPRLRQRRQQPVPRGRRAAVSPPAPVGPLCALPTCPARRGLGASPAG